MTTKITVLGSGAMATACSILLADHAGQFVTIWARNAENAEDFQKNRENRRLLPGVRIPETVQVTAELPRALDGADYLVVSIPTKFLRKALEYVAPHFNNDCPVISVVKGLENRTFQRPSEIITEILGNRLVAALGGPSHAEEIARRLPASVVAASDDLEFAKQVQKLFATDRFRVYTNRDIVGVELAGALKNVIGIAAGICDGLEYGDNAKSALITRGIVEMTRFGVSCGAEQKTFSGLAGMGDLITTCFSPHGRNRKVGERLGRGEKLQEILTSMEAVAEGVTSTKSVLEYAETHNIDMPITREVYRILFENASPEEATVALMMRPQKGE
ncbi:MAG: NAD(P)H-dependent glycerol-3-phosphate dehydrogenase [Planctomycetaceae bacterium]